MLGLEHALCPSVAETVSDVTMSTHLARKSLPTTTLVIKDLVCGMADILWREKSRTRYSCW